MKKLMQLLGVLVCALLFVQLAFAQAAAPVCTPAAGTYASTQSVSCSTITANADLFYTLDNTTPTPESTKYSGPITVSANTTLKIIAAVAGIRRSNIQNDDPTAGGTYWKAADYINGGASGIPTGLNHSSGHASPSLSGASMEFSMTAQPGHQTNVLWAAGTGFGQCDTCSYELFDYQLYLDTGVCTNNGTAEQDDFKIASSLGNLRYMGGAQWRRTGGCTSGHACLDIGGNSNVHWTFTGVDIPLACGTFHHMQRAEHFAPAEVSSKPCVDFNGAHWPYIYEDYWIVDGTRYDNGGAGWKFCANSVNWPSWEAPQFQFDATNGTHTMYLDQANFTAYFPASTVSSSVYTITGGTGTPTASTPSISPTGGFYTSTQTVTLADSTPGAVIHYTTDGSTPTNSSSTYTSALTVTSTTTLKAIAIAGGYNNSAVASAVYSFSGSGGLTATPTLSPTGGSYTTTQYVTMSDTTSGAVIYYTTDGTTPTPSSNVYSVPLAVSATATIKAMAVASGLTNSSVISATYTITATLTAATPTFSPLAGNYTGTQTVTISDSTPSSTIHYTTDGSTPTGASTTYTTPLTVSSTTTVKAIAVASGLTNSAVGTALYTIGCGATGLVTGNIDYSQLKAGSRQGAGAQIQMATGGFTANDLLGYDCNGNAIDSALLISAVATKNAVQQESYIYAADTGTANAYAITLSPVPTIVAGSIATLKVGHTNTGASTLAVNGGSAAAIKKGDGTVALAASDWTAGQIVTVKYDGTNWQWGGGSSSSGTVTSVGLSLPAIFSVSGTPVATAGTLSATLATQTANTFFAGPSSGAAAAPTFRAIVAGDLPLGSAAAFGAVKCDGTTITCASGVISSVSGTGTVTSVALSMPSDYSVSGSPVTGAGTFTVTGGTTKSAIQQQSYIYAADTGSANAYAVTLSPAPTIIAGSHVVFKAANANTTASTLAVNGGTATAIKKQGSTALVSGDIPAGGIEEVVYDGTNYQLIASASTSGGSSPLTTKGDLFGFDTANNRIPVGADTQVLTADSTQTLGVKWAAAGLTNPMTTQGDLIYGGASGTPTRLAGGTSTYVLTSNGPTAAPSWQAAAGGASGAMVLVEAHTASSSAELDFTTCFTSTYDEYEIDVVGLNAATNGALPQLQFSTNGGSSYDATSIYDFADYVLQTGTSASGTAGSASQAAINLFHAGLLSTATPGLTGSFKLYDPLSTTNYKFISGQGIAQYSADSIRYMYVNTGVYRNTTAANAFRLKMSTGNIAAGKVRCYGIAH